jgi:hypothetical protein
MKKKLYFVTWLTWMMKKKVEAMRKSRPYFWWMMEKECVSVS